MVEAVPASAAAVPPAAAVTARTSSFRNTPSGCPTPPCLRSRNSHVPARRLDMATRSGLQLSEQDEHLLTTPKQGLSLGHGPEGRGRLGRLALAQENALELVGLAGLEDRQHLVARLERGLAV